MSPFRGVETYLKPERRLGSLLSAASAGIQETDDLLLAPTAAPSATVAPVVKPRSQPVVTAAPQPAPEVWSPSNTLAPMGFNIGDVPLKADNGTAPEGMELVTLKGWLDAV